MRYVVFQTEACIKDAKTYGLSDSINRLAKKVEADQSIANWDKFLPSPYLKKSLGTHRLMAEQRLLEDAIFICFLGVSPRAGEMYEKFLQANSATWKDRSPRDDTLRSYLNERTSLPDLITEPTDSESAYLRTALSVFDYSDGVVYESRDWVESSTNPELEKHLLRYSELVLEALGESNSEKTLLVHASGREKILYKRIRLADRLEPAIFLATPLLGDDSKKEQIESRYAGIFGVSDGIEEETVLRQCGRAYPALIVSDENVWAAIQKNREGNLALSPEESRILDQIRNRAGDSIYPLFINGRPGSGKSTVLQYLFADYLHLHLCKDDRLAESPLYLTYSNNLLLAAKQAVETILRCNSHKATDYINLASDPVRSIISKSFAEFQSLLRSFLSGEQSQHFSSEKKMDFRTFRIKFLRAFKGHPEAEIRRLSPELAWHVIRTYIKGMRQDSETYFGPIDYKELPAKQKTVDQHIFEAVYEKVWQRWYQGLCETGGFWDDQDLARKVLDLDVDISRYPAIFCDEAQDFTKIELELILRLSLFSRRTVSPQELRFVPFAFAGDPFQTLNPTGFDWPAVQASFHEKIVQALDRSSKAKLRFNYQELSCNYRSMKSIVGFCNLVQLMRGVLFDKKDISPQQSWFTDESPMPVVFDIDDQSCQRNLQEQSELVFILPCQENGEEEYVRSDEYLAGFPGQNFLSTIRAKGLEFSRIVLYKFGEECCQNYPELLEPLETGIPHSISPESALPLEYFINRLYVGASRAQKRLFIVDTKRGIENFWHHSSIRHTENLLTQFVKGRGVANELKWSIEDLCGLQPGYEESWSEAKDDPAKLGEMFRNDGLAQRDAYKLDKARWNFKRVGRESDALDCEAKMLEIEESFEAAGNIYLKLKQTANALRCFWTARSYATIKNHAEFNNTLERKVADFVAGALGPSCSNQLLDFLLKTINGPSKDRILSEPQFVEVCEQVIESSANWKEADVSWPSLHSKLSEIAKSGIRFEETRAYGEVAYRANQYGEAKSVWERHGATATEKYKDASAHVLTENYELGKAGAESVETLVAAYVRLRKFENAAALLAKHPSEKMSFDLMALTRNDDRATFLKVAEDLLKTRAQNKRWREVITLMRSLELSSQESKRINAHFAFQIASSRDLPDLAVKQDLDELADYLKKTFLDGVWDSTLNTAIIGTAIERANRIVDSLDFYERIWKTQRIPANPDEQRHARTRWYKCKLRQSLTLDERGRTADAQRYAREAEEFAVHSGIKTNEIAEYTDVSSSSIHLPLPGFRISETQRRMILASVNAGLGAEEIAAALGVSLEEVRTVIEPH